ncbi:hypothetical protein Nmel_002229 [Mimus melanotis]
MSKLCQPQQFSLAYKKVNFGAIIVPCWVC